jgi:CRISPR-associated endonuclease/helicase Cas3
MTEYFAHSPKDGIPAQTYEAHVNGVLARVRDYASTAAKYSADGASILTAAETAAVYHDLGKLDKENQTVLSGKKKAKKLPVHHQDAGTAFLLDSETVSLLAAVTVAAHHKGLPEFVREIDREESAFRDGDIKASVDKSLPEYLRIHNGIIKTPVIAENEMPKGDVSVFLRLLLSCIADADHTDTATHYGKYPANEPNIPLHAEGASCKLGFVCSESRRFRRRARSSARRNVRSL